ncbi:MAG: hypothetical protein R3C20_08095 [Planctomycetaceae bacterium]
MNSAHDWLGLGTLPEAPIVSYLTRSLSLLYFIFALFTLGIAGNLRQYKPLVGIWGQAAGIAGIVLFGIDWHAGMPYAWTFTEGPPGIIIGATIYTLHHRIGPSIQEPASFRETRPSRETLPGE